MVVTQADQCCQGEGECCGGEGERKDPGKAQMFLVLVVPFTDIGTWNRIGVGGKMQLITLNLRLKEAVGCPLSSCPCDSTAISGVI